VFADQPCTMAAGAHINARPTIWHPEQHQVTAAPSTWYSCRVIAHRWRQLLVNLPSKQKSRHREGIGWLAVKGLERCGIKIRKWVTVERICLIGEPALVLLVGLALRQFSQVLGAFLQCSAGALFFKAIIIQQRMMNMKRDQWDARIMSEWLIGVHKDGSPAGKREFLLRGEPLK